MIPDVIRIEPSSKCNLRCQHCPTGLGFNDGGIMSQETFEKILENLTLVPRVAVLYHGGEPTLCRKLWAWIRTLKDMGVQHIKINTNGMTLREHFDDILNSGLDELVVAIDGKTLEENDSIRCGSNCNKVIQNVKDLADLKLSRKPAIKINNTLITNHVIGTPEFLRDAFAGYELTIQSLPAINWAGFNMGFDRPYQIKNGNCSFADETMTIRWNGDVVPCCYDIAGKYVLGNIYDFSLKEIWENDRYRELKESLRKGEPIALCKGCLV